MIETQGPTTHPGWRVLGRLAAHRWTVTRLLLFTLVTGFLAFGNMRELSRSIPGNPGDAFLVMSLLEWNAHHFLEVFGSYWAGPMFAGGRDAMGYSDTLLPLGPLFGALEIVTGSRVLAFNILFLASWIFCAEATYVLAHRLVRSRAVATVAAITFTFSTIRLAQASHFQLAWAGFTPLALLLLFRYREHRSVGRAAAVVVVLVLQLLTSAYYGVTMIAFSSAVMFIDGCVVARRGGWRSVVRPAIVYFGGLLLLLAPLQYAYHVAGQSALPRGDYPEFYELRLVDLRTPAPSASLPRQVQFLDPPVDVRSENFAYVGAFVLVFVPVALGVFALGRQRRSELGTHLAEWCSIAGLGVFGFVIAVGRGPLKGIPMPFYDIAVRIIPGMHSVVAIVRMVIFAQLAAVLVGASGLAAVLRRRHVALRVVVTSLVLGFVVVEARIDHEIVRVVQPADGSVYAAMQGLDKGVVLELPIASRDAGIVYAFLEATRMVLSTDDDLRSVNGYSGHTPKGYDAAVPVLNGFPSAAAIAEIQSLGVDYVVIHTDPIDTGMPGVTDAVNGSGYAYVDAVAAEAMIATAPAGLITGRVDADDGVILVLADD